MPAHMKWISSAPAYTTDEFCLTSVLSLMIHFDLTAIM